MDKLSTVKRAVIWLSLMLAFAFTLVVYITFMWIYFHPEDSYFITLTLFGERNLEFVLLVVLAPIVLVGFLWNIKLLLRKSGRQGAGVQAIQERGRGGPEGG